MKRWIELNEDKSENIPYGHTEYPFYILHTFLSEYPNYAAPVLHNNNIPYDVGVKTINKFAPIPIVP